MSTKDITLIPCPVKGTMVHKWVCSGKCTRTEGQCRSARLAMAEETKYCLECQHDETDNCAPCLVDGETGYREKRLWALATEVVPETKAGGPVQMSLF